MVTSYTNLNDIINDSNNIRNIAIISDKSHGESTLINQIVSQARLDLQSQLQYNIEDQKENEALRPKKSVNTSLFYEYYSEIEDKKGPYLINLVTFAQSGVSSIEPNPALKLIDGIVLEVDCVEGVTMQTERILRHCLHEKVKPVLAIKNFYQTLEPEAIYQRLYKLIESINTIISTYSELDNKFMIGEGDILFMKGDEYSWGFSITRYAHLYAKKFGISANNLASNLWGDNYYDPEAKKWINNYITENGKTLKRGFVQFIMEPIIKLSTYVFNENQEQISDFSQSIEVELSDSDIKLKGEHLLNLVLSKWIDFVGCFMEMSILQLPSPKSAQKYRTSHLYEGSFNDRCYQSMNECDPKGSLIIYIIRTVPTTSNDIFFAFGRIYSGTIATGQKVRMMGPHYKCGKKEDLIITTVKKIAILDDASATFVDQVSCGNIVGLILSTNDIFKPCIISNEEPASFRTSKYSLSPLVQVAMEPKNAADLPKLIDALNKLAKSDPLTIVTSEYTGQHMIAGYDEARIQNSLKDLKNDFVDFEVKESDIRVLYRETVSTLSPLCLAKSPNKQNRLFCMAEPLPYSLCESIEKGETGPNVEPNLRINILNQQFGFDSNAARKIWAFGPEPCGPNIFIDNTTRKQYVDEIKESCRFAFGWVTKEGVLCEENMRGVKINLTDVVLHSDAIHRGHGQIIPTARRVCYGCELTAEPKLQEPVFLGKILTSFNDMNDILSFLVDKKAKIFEQEPLSGTKLFQCQFFIPLTESIGLSSWPILNHCTFSSFSFSHWEVIDSNPLDINSEAYKIVASIRKQKGLKEGPPDISNYLDYL